MSRLGGAFRRARDERRAAFIGYLTAGDPDEEATVGLAMALDRAGADVLELGVPFSDPIADGPVIQRASTRALAGGTTLQSVFSLARRIREKTSMALVLFSYFNPILRCGAREAAARARDAGFDGVLLTDVPPEEMTDVHPILAGAGLDTILLVSPTSTDRRMAEAARLSTGFLYVVSRPGTTGARAKLPADLEHTVRRARQATPADSGLPVAVGFGISTPETARAAARLADGVIVGSALVHAAETGGAKREESVERLARALVAACRRTGASTAP